MDTKYIDFIHQNFKFPQDDFALGGSQLSFHGMDLMQLVHQYGSPLRYTFLPKISGNIDKTKRWFHKAFENIGYRGKYHYCYCTKSSHFEPMLQEVVKNEVHIETSSNFDVDIVERLREQDKIGLSTYIICNGFKPLDYINGIARLINGGHENCVPVLDNYEELDELCQKVTEEFTLGIRIASEERPKAEFQTSRLGIEHKEILPFYRCRIRNNKKAVLKMLHFFINTGISDSAYYWGELKKCLRIYVALKKICPSLDSLNIGGGLPIKNSLAFAYDYEGMIYRIVDLINTVCKEGRVSVPHIFTEFGSFTVGESGGVIFKILRQKQQNDTEKWNMIDSSFINTLPDTWAINKKFMMLPINRWHDSFEKVLLGGLTCDGDDHYTNEGTANAIYLPRFNKSRPLYIGFFNTGAYQEAISGHGGLQHCLIPQPKHILIHKDTEGHIITRLFSDQQSSEELLNILGYEPIEQPASNRWAI